MYNIDLQLMRTNKSKTQRLDLLTLNEPQPKKEVYEWQTVIQSFFRDNIEAKINQIQALTKRGEPQRCFDHNIPYSLYCTHCRKIICASCMYSYTTHKKHKVVPLQSSDKQIREDIQNIIIKMDNKNKACIKAVDDANNKILLSNREYEKSIFQLDRFYDDVIDMMKKKRQEQLDYLIEKQEEAKQELKTYYRCISQIQIFVLQKFGTYGNSQVKFELMVPSKGILEILNNSVSSIQWLQADLDHLRFELDPAKMIAIKSDLKCKLEAINKTTISNDIKIMEKKVSSKRLIVGSSLSSPKKATLKVSKQKMNNLSILASPRSVRRR